jgi:hypothetical protein
MSEGHFRAIAPAFSRSETLSHELALLPIFAVIRVLVKHEPFIPDTRPLNRVGCGIAFSPVHFCSPVHQ